MSTFEIVAAIAIPALALGIAFLGSRWKRIRNTLVELGKAVEDDEITRRELRAIVEALLGRSLDD